MQDFYLNEKETVKKIKSCCATYETYKNGFIVTWKLHQIIMCSKKWHLNLAKITIPPIHLLYPIPSPLTGLTKWSINGFHVSNLNGRQFFPRPDIHVYFISILMNARCLSEWNRNCNKNFTFALVLDQSN